MPIADYYSTPADVRALITMMAQLGLAAKPVTVWNTSGQWQVMPTEPVLPSEFKEDKPDLYSVCFSDDNSEQQNVAALLKQARTMAMPPLYRAWYLYLQVSGKVISIDDFQGHLANVSAIKNAWEEKLQAILEGK
jgi:hypothetical protein